MADSRPLLALLCNAGIIALAHSSLQMRGGHHFGACRPVGGRHGNVSEGWGSTLIDGLHEATGAPALNSGGSLPPTSHTGPFSATTQTLGHEQVADRGVWNIWEWNLAHRSQHGPRFTGAKKEHTCGSLTKGNSRRRRDQSRNGKTRPHRIDLLLSKRRHHRLGRICPLV